MKKTSFVKKQMKQVLVSGTHPSIHNGLLLVSTGIPTLDDLLGGGLPIGTVFLVEEDYHCRFSNIMVKYFLAEGVMCQHGLFVASTNDKSKNLLENLPKPVSSNRVRQESDSGNMRIAFMYKNLPQHTSALSDTSKFGHYYDISSNMDTSFIKKCEAKSLIVNPDSIQSEQSNFFKYTLERLKEQLDANKCYKPPTAIEGDTRVNVLRMTIPNLASPLWCSNDRAGTKDIAQFLHSLRALARKTMLVCMITMPTHLFTSSQVASFRHLVDCSVQLDAFVGETNPAFSQYHGMFKIHKLPCVNSLAPSVPDSFDLAFVLKRTKFLIECFHLPPDLTETASRQGMDEGGKSPLCGGTKLKSNLDF